MSKNFLTSSVFRIPNSNSKWGIIKFNFLKRVIQGIHITETPVDATYNWWGSERPGYINGKIWDGRDNDSLVDVNFQPYRVSNVSLVNGTSIHL